MDTIDRKRHGSAANTPLFRYGVAVAVVAAAVLVRGLLDPWLDGYMPLTTLYGAVAVAVLAGGYRPALLAAAVGFLACSFLFVEPRGSMWPHGAAQWFGFAGYLLSCGLIIGFGGAMRVARRRDADQKERLRTTLASIGDGVITTDTAGRVTNLNAVAETLTGWANADARGRPLDAVFAVVDETTRQPVGNPASRALKEGTVASPASRTLLVARDGTERPIDDSAAPIRNRDGQVVGCVLVFRDTTERRRAEREREAVQRTFFTLIERCPFGIYIVDSDFRITHMNAESQGGAFRNVRPVIGRRLDEALRVLWPESVAAEIGQKFRHTLDSGEPYNSADFVNPRADIGRIEGYEWELHHIALPDGRPGVVCFYYDSTKLRQAERALREADRQKDEFLATLAHELRNPLAPIRNGIQIMKLAGGKAEAVERSRGMIERQVEQMARLIDDLMDLSRINQGKITLRKSRMRLSEAIRDAVPDEPIFVDGDGTRLTQVFANLLNNAAKYTDRGGRIRLAVERQGGEVVVSVEDTGVGIPADMLPRVFDMFAQVDGSLEKAQGGLGIGLNIVKKLVEKHAGTVGVQSAGHGRGSTFTVRLPVVLSLAALTTEEGPVNTVAPARRRILVVDDNADGAASLAEMLGIMGNDTQTAHDGLEAVAVAGAFRPDVILMDIGMPRMNGFDACRRIRAEAWGKGIVMVAQTGWGQDDDKHKAKQAGFDLHMTKPVDPTALEKLLTGMTAATG